MSAGVARARRGRTAPGRARASRSRAWDRPPGAPPLLSTTDHGAALAVPREVVAPEIQSDAWVDAFMGANEDALHRLDLRPEITTERDGAHLRLLPGPRIGALPLRSASARRVVAGLLVAPRFTWDGIGRVLGSVAFRIEPEISSSSLVPGSAREVPPWVLAGPVLARLADVLRHVSRRFALATELRERPRGTVDWNHYGRASLPCGQWQSFRCTYPDLRDDDRLYSAMRWTASRVQRELERAADAPIARVLLEEASLLLQRLGAGPETRPQSEPLAAWSTLGGGWLAAAWEAMGWVADERGLGGERSLDGLPWSLRVDALWEAWVETILEDLALRTGARFSSARRGETTRALHWTGHIRTLSHLAPDFALAFQDRTVFVDAKYKAHLMEFHLRGWNSVGEATREAHRADLHQALAYASLSDVPIVETALVYPVPPGEHRHPFTAAELVRGARASRLSLVGIPFGFATPPLRERTVAELERHLRGGAP